jgi:hypothetical protein
MRWRVLQVYRVSISASDGTTSQPKLSCEGRFLIGSCINPKGYESPRARHATVISVSPSKLLFLQDRSVARHWQALDTTGFPLYK